MLLYFLEPLAYLFTSFVAQTVKYLPTMWETWVWSLGLEDPLQKEMATHSSIHAWKIPWTEEPGGLQSMGSQRVGHNWATSLSFIIFIIVILNFQSDNSNNQHVVLMLSLFLQIVSFCLFSCLVIFSLWEDRMCQVKGCALYRPSVV